jgi:hypothetical protein
MGATNNFKGKEYMGTFAGGEGPIKGQTISTQSETSGQISRGEGGGKNLKTVGGSSDAYPSGSAGLFDVQGKGYAGPQNLAFKPVDKGVVSNQPNQG